MKTLKFLFAQMLLNASLAHSNFFRNFETGSESRKTWNKYLTNFCNNFNYYFIIIHVDDTTVRSLDDFIKSSDHVMIFNYNKRIPKRSDFGNSLNVVFISNILPFESYSVEHKSTHNVYIFIESGSILISKTWMKMGSRSPVRLFFLHLVENGVNIYEYLSYAQILTDVTSYNFTKISNTSDFG